MQSVYMPAHGLLVFVAVHFLLRHLHTVLSSCCWEGELQECWKSLCCIQQ